MSLVSEQSTPRRDDVGTANGSDPRADAGDFQLSDRAYAVLIKAIATCELPPGAALNERDQSAALGMSRTPLRQAFHRLGLEKLVVTIPRRGAFVTLLDLEDIQDNLEVRNALESAAIRRVVTERLPIDIVRLERVLSTMRRAARENEARVFLEADEEFHLTLVEATGNRRAVEALERAWVHINRARYLKAPSRATMSRSAKQHAEILDAVRADALVAAERAVSGHVRKASDMFGDLVHEFPWAFVPPANGA